MPFRILSFDGGGICGLISLNILKRLQSACPSILKDVDLLAGTSTGGLIAMGLAQGDTVDDLISLYETKGPTIFQKATFGSGGVVHCRYENDGYRELLREHFGDRKLGGLNKRVLVPAFCINTSINHVHCWKPKVFVNFPDDDVDCKLRCADVALWTSAAPTYFPIADYYIDGGVCANNPSMCALAGSLALGKDLPSVKLMSFGTGIFPQYIESKDGDWGLTQWGTRLVDILIGGSELVPDYQCRNILRDGYIRVDPSMKEEISLDDWKACDKLLEAAMGYDIGPASEWLLREWQCDPTK